jgi:two-component system cell cycle sensor histidine kinase/response regulator CckA
VYLPAAAGESVRPSRVTTPQLATGSGEVLIVDDEPLVRASMARVLRLAGYQVTEASSGVDAVELFRQAPDRFRVVILDMVMPRMGGRATFAALQALRADVSVLAVSGYDANDDIQPMLAAGARGFLAKPCSIHDLTSAVAGILVADAAREGR